MRPAKGHKLTSEGEVFSLRAQRKAAPKVYLAGEARVNFRNSGMKCGHDSARASIMEAPVAQTKNSKTWKNFHDL